MSENFKSRPNMVYPGIYVDNFRELINSTLERFPDKIAFSYKKDPTSKTPEFINVTYKEHYEDIKNLGTKLLSMGLEEKKVGLIGHNKYQWPVSYQAINNSNMVCVPLDYMLPENEIENLLIRSNCEAIIFDGKFLNIFKNIKNRNKTNLKYYICMDLEENSDGILAFYNLINEGKQLCKSGNTSFDNIKIDSDKMSVMIFTSGTTDIAKAVMLSQRNICSNFSAMTTLLKTYEEDKVLSFLPLHHTFECTATYLFSFFTGFTICYCDGLKHIPKNMNEYGITGLVCVPALLEVMYRQINKTIKNKGLTVPFKIMMAISNFLYFLHIDIRRNMFKSVLDNLGGKIRIIIYGSASVDKKITKFFNSLGIKTLQGYGLTETSPVISCENDKYQRPGSCGHILYNQDVQIINKDENGIGEITVKGPNIMLGYYNNEEKTKEVLVDGYFHTGDLGYIDKDGYLFVTGRIKDMIVLKNGKKIFPQEIEILLNESPLIEESFIYLSKNSALGNNSATDEDGKISTKLVYSKENELLNGKNEEEIYELLKNEVKLVNSKIPSYKYIKNITITTEPLIKTTTQKIKRHEEMLRI